MNTLSILESIRLHYFNFYNLRPIFAWITERRISLYSVVLLAAVTAVMFFRRNEVEEPIRVEGKTMGTTYHITYFDKKGRNFKNSVDSLLMVVNKSINNYDPTSEVSRFNTSTTGFKFDLPYLYPPIKKAAGSLSLQATVHSIQRSCHW